MLYRCLNGFIFTASNTILQLNDCVCIQCIIFDMLFTAHINQRQCAKTLGLPSRVEAGVDDYRPLHSFLFDTTVTLFLGPNLFHGEMPNFTWFFCRI